MKFSRQDVIDIVDALFHMYASDYRFEAKEELLKMMQRQEYIKVKTIGETDCSFCDSFPEEILGCDSCYEAWVKSKILRQDREEK